MDLCKALQVEYTEKPGDAPSRGEKSAAAKAADGISTSYSYLTIVNVSERLEKKVDRSMGISKETPLNGLDLGAKDIKQGMLTV